MPRRPPTTSLREYRTKRKAGATAEPFGSGRSASGATPNARFAVQLHHASHKHFDLRLQLDGVLKSWAVPKGPSSNPDDKRFAVQVEDHPLEYADFEGEIPAGNYGAGWVVVWDRGVWRPLNDPHKGLASGKLLFDLDGCKLRGRWTLVRLKDNPKNWLFIKERDSAARDDEEFTDTSVFSGLTVQELANPRSKQTALTRRLAAVSKKPWPEQGFVAPMLAKSEPAFDRKDWVFEIKFDGYRLMIDRTAAKVTLYSRNGKDLTRQFAEVATAALRFPAGDFLLDTEVVVHDDSGRPSFSMLQQRLSEGDAGRPATAYAFDLLRLLGKDVRDAPLVKRKQLLEGLAPAAGIIRYVSHIPEYGRAAYEQARQIGLEGVIGKRADSTYRSGRSDAWIKVRADRGDDFAVLGYTPTRNDADDLGALLLGEYRNGTLTYVGRVGTGFTAATRKMLMQKLTALPRSSPLTDTSGAKWCKPVLAAEVRYREYSRDGMLRHPVFVRLRDDKRAQECVGRFSASPAQAALSPAPDIPKQPRRLALTNPEKVFWPELGLTKKHLVNYYRQVSPWLLPYLRDRPVVLTRYPDGIHGKSFFQKDAPAFVPDWVRTEVLWSDGAEREVRYFLVDDTDMLAYLANMATIPLHVWSSRVSSLANPDWSIIDLDPKDAPFADVITLARGMHEIAEELQLPHYLKTTGSTGLHVLFPLGRQLTHDQSRTFAELLARLLVQRHPDIATINRALPKRQQRVYVDYLQNGHGRLLVAPYSARPVPSAAVSMPLAWSELSARLRNERFTLKNAFGFLKKWSHDPLLNVLTDHPDLAGALARLAELMRDPDGLDE